MSWMACLSSERSSHPDTSLHDSGITDLRRHINMRLVTLLGTRSVAKAARCEKGQLPGISTGLARAQICLMCAAVWRTCDTGAPWRPHSRMNRLICAAAWRSEQLACHGGRALK